MEKRPISLSEKIKDMNEEVLLTHFLRLLPVLKNANLFTGFEKDSSQKRKEFALNGLLKILQLTDGKFPYMFFLSLNKKGKVLDMKLYKNPVFDWPYEAIGSVDSKDYLQELKKIREKKLPAFFNQTAESGSINLINPLKNPFYEIPYYGLKELFELLGVIKTEKEKNKILITGSVRETLLIGSPNPEYFNRLDNNSPYKKNILDF